MTRIEGQLCRFSSPNDDVMHVCAHTPNVLFDWRKNPTYAKLGMKVFLVLNVVSSDLVPDLWWHRVLVDASVFWILDDVGNIVAV